METEHLERCPFCGGEAIVSAYDTEVDGWRVACNSPEKWCRGETFSTDSPEAAIEAWNRRTPPPQAAPQGDVPLKSLHYVLEFAEIGVGHDQYDSDLQAVRAWLATQRPTAGEGVG